MTAPERTGGEWWKLYQGNELWVTTPDKDRARFLLVAANAYRDADSDPFRLERMYGTRRSPLRIRRRLRRRRG